MKFFRKLGQSGASKTTASTQQGDNQVKASKSWNKLRGTRRSTKTNDHTMDATSSEHVEAQKTTFGRIKSALRLKRSKASRYDSASPTRLNESTSSSTTIETDVYSEAQVDTLAQLQKQAEVVQAINDSSSATDAFKVIRAINDSSRATTSEPSCSANGSRSTSDGKDVSSTSSAINDPSCATGSDLSCSADGGQSTSDGNDASSTSSELSSSVSKPPGLSPYPRYFDTTKLPDELKQFWDMFSVTRSLAAKPQCEENLIELYPSIFGPTAPATVNLTAGFNESHQHDSPETHAHVLPNFNVETCSQRPTETRSDALLRMFGRICEIPHSDILQLVADTFPCQAQAVEVTGMRNGTFNCVYFIKREDDSTILLRVPAVGREDLWTAEDAHMMTTDFRTARFIKSKTTIPMPAMLHYDVGFDNAIKAPHMFTSLVPGKSLGEAQMAWASEGDDAYDQKTAKVMAQLGAALAQLSKSELHFKEIGMLEFDDDECRNPRVGRTYLENSTDYGNAMPMLSIGNGRHIPARDYPLSCSKSFFKEAFILNMNYDLTGIQLAYQRIVALGLDLVPDSKLYYGRHRKESFGLRHLDMDVQNTLVDDEGNLEGIIDWSGTGTAPNYLSQASMPKCLVRDFTPWRPLYFDEDPKAGFEDAKLKEQRRIVEENFNENLVGKIGAKYIKQSPWFAAFERACNNFSWGGRPVGWQNFVDKLFCTEPTLNKGLFLDYLENTGDEWPLYSEYYKSTTNMPWPYSEINIKETLIYLIRANFDCEEGLPPGYYGEGPRGLQLTLDMPSSLTHLDMNAARMELDSLLRHKKRKEKAMGQQNFRRFKHQLDHRLGVLEYDELLAKAGNEQPALVDAQAVAPGVEPLVGYQSRASRKQLAHTGNDQPASDGDQAVASGGENIAENADSIVQLKFLSVVGYKGRAPGNISGWLDG